MLMTCELLQKELFKFNINNSYIKCVEHGVKYRYVKVIFADKFEKLTPKTRKTSLIRYNEKEFHTNISVVFTYLFIYFIAYKEEQFIESFLYIFLEINIEV